MDERKRAAVDPRRAVVDPRRAVVDPRRAVAAKGLKVVALPVQRQLANRVRQEQAKLVVIQWDLNQEKDSPDEWSAVLRRFGSD